MLCGQRSRDSRPCLAARSRCIRIRWTKRSPCRLRTRREWRSENAPLVTPADRVVGVGTEGGNPREARLLAVALENGSGHALLDQAALDTFRRAEPLPPVPADRSAPVELSFPVEFFMR